MLFLTVSHAKSGSIRMFDDIRSHIHSVPDFRAGMMTPRRETNDQPVPMSPKPLACIMSGTVGRYHPPPSTVPGGNH